MSPEYLWNVWNRMLQASPSEAAWGLLSSTPVCAALGVVIGLVVVRVRSGRLPVMVASRADHLALGAIALMVGVLWIGDIVLRGYVFNMSAVVSWWRFAPAPTVAAAGIAAWGMTRRTARIRRAPDAATATRRTWTTFGPRRGTFSKVADRLHAGLHHSVLQLGGHLREALQGNPHSVIVDRA